MFREAPEDIVDLLVNEDVTVNAHQFCVLDEVSHDALNSDVLLTNKSHNIYTFQQLTVDVLVNKKKDIGCIDMA